MPIRASQPGAATETAAKLYIYLKKNKTSATLGYKW